MTIALGRAVFTAFTTVSERPMQNTYWGPSRCISALMPLLRPTAGVSSTGPA